MRVRRRLIVIEAAVALTAARLALAMIPPRRLLNGIAPAAPGSSGTPPEAGVAVGWAIERATRRLPWTSTCLVRALAGRFMLRCRRIPCTLHLGVATATGRLEAHAWLSVGDHILTGGPEAAGFTPLARIG